ncbi:hypothetical protein [Sneathiella sp.]|uniref:hypothetical protein n=1 Tax=Sneathiella sp. TaxID=1964365 RepID=UPI002FE00E7F
MSKIEEVELEAYSVMYFGPNDESAFFEWIEKIPSISNYFGEGRSLFMTVDMKKLNETDLRSIIALFHRYKIEKKQLKVFNTGKFSKWFSDPIQYWYEDVFK